MPYNGVPASKTDKLDRCVIKVMGQGHDKSSAIAICEASIMGKEVVIDGMILKDGEFTEVNHEGVTLFKQDDGRYKITTVSSAALRDMVNETVSTAAMDYDIKMAELTGEYPEYRLFHKEALAIGQVEKMYRVGIFMVDEGHSYDDPFSLEVCEKMLANNTGKWRCSRGFYAIEASGGCPGCGSTLLVHQKQMVIGFSCPACGAVHISYKGVLKDLHFQKMRTFDVTVTDKPCVPYTGASAIKISGLEDTTMTKKELEEKLKAAGLQPDVIATKLASITDAQLKEFDGIPEATLLKEFEAEEPEQPEPEQEEDAEEQTFVLGDDVLKAFADLVDERIGKALDGLTVDIPDNATSFKEAPEVLAQLARIEKMLTLLTTPADKRVKEALEDAPRNAGLRVLRFKAAPKKGTAADDEEDAADQGDDETAEEGMPPAMVAAMKKKKAAMMGKKSLDDDGALIMDSAGNKFGSMTDFVTGGK